MQNDTYVYIYIYVHFRVYMLFIYHIIIQDDSMVLKRQLRSTNQLKFQFKI